MKKILTIALLLIAINAQGQGLPVAANATLASLFPDENLRRVVAEVLGPNAGLTGQRLSDALARIEGVFYITNISNARGIEHLTGVAELFISDSNITDDLNFNTLANLTNLNITQSKLASVYVGNLPNLFWFVVRQSEITNLHFDNLPVTLTVFFMQSEITNLHLSNIRTIHHLRISNSPSDGQ